VLFQALLLLVLPASHVARCTPHTRRILARGRAADDALQPLTRRVTLPPLDPGLLCPHTSHAMLSVVLAAPRPEQGSNEHSRVSSCKHSNVSASSVVVHGSATLLALPSAVCAELQGGLWPRMVEEVWAASGAAGRVQVAAGGEAGAGAAAGPLPPSDAEARAEAEQVAWAAHFQPLLRDLSLVLDARQQQQQQQQQQQPLGSTFFSNAPAALDHVQASLLAFAEEAELHSMQSLLLQVR